MGAADRRHGAERGRPFRGTRPAPEVRVLGGTLLAIGLGEELWQSFLPAYVAALGGSGAIVGLFGSCRDLLDGLYQVPGGWIADRYGARRAIVLFIVTALIGYAAYAIAWHWSVAFVGLAAAMAWKAGAFPATFAAIGDAMPRGARVAGFTVQSIAVRIPRVIAAPAGGVLVWRFGLMTGLRVAMIVTMVLALLALIAQVRQAAAPGRARSESWRPLRSTIPAPLVRLLVAECFVRVGEAIAASFVILYVTSVRAVPLPMFGALYALQQAVSLALYLPASRLTVLLGTRTLVAATFACFALFPLALLLAPGWIGIVVAFVIGGFKEIGEPTRKASIVDGCHPDSQAREVGTYYAVRNLVIVPAGIIGGLLWQHSPALVLGVAGAVSALGLLIFAAGSGHRR